MEYMGWDWQQLQSCPLSIYDKVVESIKKQNERQRRDAAKQRRGR